MKVSELLSSKEKWCQGQFSICGRRCLYRAVRDSGQDLAACTERLASSILRLFPKERPIYGDVSLILFNDTHTYEEVMQVVRDADV